MWNPNRRELFYRNGDKMMAVDISTRPGFAASTPRMLFGGRYEQPPVPLHSSDYDVITTRNPSDAHLFMRVTSPHVLICGPGCR